MCCGLRWTRSRVEICSIKPTYSSARQFAEGICKVRAATNTCVTSSEPCLQTAALACTVHTVESCKTDDASESACTSQQSVGVDPITVGWRALCLQPQGRLKSGVCSSRIASVLSIHKLFFRAHRAQKTSRREKTLSGQLAASRRRQTRHVSRNGTTDVARHDKRHEYDRAPSRRLQVSEQVARKPGLLQAGSAAIWQRLHEPRSRIHSSG